MGIINKINRKAQFYILTAVILCVSAFTAISSSNSIYGNSDSIFQEYVNNFKSEAPNVINSAIYNNYDIELELSYFINDYENYLENLDKELSLVYLLKYNNKLVILNKYAKSITIKIPANTFTLASNTKINLTATKWATIKIDNDDYNYNFNDSEPVEFKVLFIG